MRTNRHRRQLTIAVISVPVLIAVAWLWGKRETAMIAQRMTFRVSGASMAPTLLGESDIATCSSCGLRWYVAALQSNELNPLCSHCGQSLTHADRTSDPPRYLGDVVDVDTRNGSRDQMTRGELVAVEWNQQIHVKRIAAIPGDIVDVERLRLTVNGIRVEELLCQGQHAADLPEFLVDDDVRRAESRWSSGAMEWHRSDDRRWKWNETEKSPWLVYSHRSMHDHGLPSPVWDDYRYNVGLTRKLEPVDRFTVSGDVEWSSQVNPNTSTIDVAFWTETGNVVATSRARPGHFSISAYDDSAHDAEQSGNLAVGPNQPVAVRVRGGPAALDNLVVRRGIEYRLRPDHDPRQYPMAVGTNKYFVVGDNVPVSIDSRDFGLVDLKQIVGVAKKRAEP